MRLALLLLIPLVLATIVIASTLRMRGMLGVDNRTYVEMAHGVRVHGLPYTLNPYSEDFPETHPPWGIPRDGKLWGNYPPLFAFVGAIGLNFGDLLGLTRENVVISGLVGLALFALGWRFTRDPLLGVATCYLAILGSPLWSSWMSTLSLPLVCLCLVISVSFAVVASERRGPASWAFAAASGVFAGASIATHLLAMPMCILLAAAILYVQMEDVHSSRWLPEQAAVARTGAFLIATIVTLVPVMVLNHVRFGTYNPVTYGPCEWFACKWSTENALDTHSLLTFALPAIPFFAAFGGGLYFARKRRAWLAAVIVVGLALLLSGLSWFERPYLMVRTLLGYVVDNSVFDIEGFESALPGKFGHPRGGYVVKALFQSSPVLMLALLVPIRRRSRVPLILFPVFGLFLSFALLARFKGSFAFGWPYLYMRYALPAVPFLALLAVVALARLPWRRAHIAIGTSVAVVLLVYLASTVGDASIPRRLLILYGTLLVAVAAVVSVIVARVRRADVWLERGSMASAVAIALSVAVSMGVDTRAVVDAMHRVDGDLDALARITSHKFAIAGYGTIINKYLALRAERDIAYMDLEEEPRDGKWENFRTLIELWTQDDREIYGLFTRDEGDSFRWPYADWDVPAVIVNDELMLWKIGPPKRRLSREEIETVLERGREQGRKQRCAAMSDAVRATACP